MDAQRAVRATLEINTRTKCKQTIQKKERAYELNYGSRHRPVSSPREPATRGLQHLQRSEKSGNMGSFDTVTYLGVHYLGHHKGNISGLSKRGTMLQLHYEGTEVP